MDLVSFLVIVCWCGRWILCYEDEIINIDTIKDKVTPQLESLMKDFIVIIDCTSATKPATIAYYELPKPTAHH